MTRQALLRPMPANRKQPLLTDTRIPSKTTGSLHSKDKNSRLGEVAGGTAAECAAVCCCCPCTLMNLLILAVYKLPAALFKKAKRKRRKKKKQQQGLLGPAENKVSHGDDELERELKAVMERGRSVNVDVDASETVDLEEEMWNGFYSTGFWRSPSQRELSS